MKHMVQQLQGMYILHKRLSHQLATGLTWRISSNMRATLKNKAIWEQAVKFFVINKLNMFRCLAARFKAAAETKGDSVFPNTLASKQYLPLYREVCRKIVPELKAELEAQREVCRNYMLSTAVDYGYNSGEMLKFTLLNKSLDMSPLFRYCLAVSENQLFVAGVFAVRAFDQYHVLAEEYDKAWGEWIPTKLKQKLKKWRGSGNA